LCNTSLGEADRRLTEVSSGVEPLLAQRTDQLGGKDSNPQ
jgi:hypothetical protein